MNILLISTYELGRQPFGLASPAAWLRQQRHEVACQDLAREKLDPNLVGSAELICFYLPMHTATRIALGAMARVRELNPAARLGCYGLYAPMNSELLRSRGVEFIVGGEFEAALVEIAGSVAADRQRLESPASSALVGTADAVSLRNGSAAMGSRNALPAEISLARLQFRVPDRGGLPELARYGKLRLADGSERLAGYTEASRGCRHRCRHCPIVPVYDGVFRVVQPEIVLADIRQQVAAGAQHITFGDPDFFNGPRHALAIVDALHREFPSLSYDVTIKVEHLLRHAQHLPALRDSGCAFVTTAVESLDDDVLLLLDKGHTRADFVRLVDVMRRADLPLSPTFIPFTPWTTRAGYAELLRWLAELDMAENVAPVQLSIRLLIPQGSRLLELAELQPHLAGYHADALSYHWRNPDPAVDELQRAVEVEVAAGAKSGLSRAETFARIWSLAHAAGDDSMAGELAAPRAPLAARATIPYLTEPWYC